VLVSFNEIVTVTGKPQITMETGVTDRVVNYYSGSGTSSLRFDYKVLAGDTSSDLDYASTTALALNGGTIRDAAGNNAILTLPTPGSANSISGTKDIIVDTTTPILVSIAPSNNAVGVAIDANIVLNFSEAVTSRLIGSKLYLKKASDDSIVQEFSIPELPDETGSQITINPTSDLLYGTTYYVTMDAGFADWARNYFPGFTDSTSLKFTTVELSCAEGGSCVVGDIGPGGGEVFFTSGLGSSKYMEVGPTTWYDNTAKQDFAWCFGKETQAIPAPGTGGSRGIGAANTARIASFCSPHGAAYWITQRNAGGGIGGQTDWFLPTKSELNYLCLYARQLPENAETCTNANPLRAGFLAQSYWSSTEFNGSYVWYQNFINGGQAYFDGTKGLRLVVRPVRSFG
jgi:hypothetical protein